MSNSSSEYTKNVERNSAETKIEAELYNRNAGEERKMQINIINILSELVT